MRVTQEMVPTCKYVQTIRYHLGRRLSSLSNAGPAGQSIPIKDDSQYDIQQYNNMD